MLLCPVKCVPYRMNPPLPPSPPPLPLSNDTNASAADVDFGFYGMSGYFEADVASPQPPPPPPSPPNPPDPPPSPQVNDTDSSSFDLFYGLDVNETAAAAPVEPFGGVILEARQGTTGVSRRLWGLTMPELYNSSNASTATGGWIAVESEAMTPGADWVLRWRHEGVCCHAWALKNITTHYVTPL